MTIKFSIITITYNNRDGFVRTRDSVRAQTCRDYEWIVIDGGSDDGTESLLDQSGAAWVSEPDRGIYDAMNKGIDRAQGDYLIFMNAGDVFAHKDVLLQIADAVAGQEPDFIYGDALEDIPGAAPAYKKARAHTKAVWGMMTHHQSMLYRRDAIGELRYDLSYKIAADYKFTMDFLQHHKAVLYCSFPFCIFEQGGVSQIQVRLGRDEQFRARREGHYTSPLQNSIIYAAQILSMTVRRFLPFLYWRLKRV